MSTTSSTSKVSRRTSLRLGGGVAALAAMLAPGLKPAPARAEGVDDIVGSWAVDVTVPGVKPFKGLNTFNADGITTTFGARPDLPASAGQPTVASPGHGAWIRVAAREYAATWMTILMDNTGLAVGTNTISQRLHLSDALNSFDGTFTNFVADLAGNQLRSGTGTSAGTRITVAAS